MTEAFICDALRTPIGRYGGALSAVRADDLAAAPIAALMARNPDVHWAEVDDVIYGCANQAGEDNRNVARMAALLSELPDCVPGATINRLQTAGTVISNQVQNLTSAENGITAADIPSAVANMTKFSILEQTGISALAQANQQQQLVLKLLQ